MNTSFFRVVGNAVSATVLFAVSAFAIYFADLSIFAESVQPLDVRSVAWQVQADDAMILNNWQFTDSQSNGNGNGKPTKKMSKHTGH